MKNTSLNTKYRPQTFEYVYGHKEVVTSLQNILERKTHRAFLFTGPSGVGKTTLARIIANIVNARITEFDAATETGKEDVENLLVGLKSRPLDGMNQCYILNEVQGLSKKAWDALLMALEEPPNWLYFCLTTTEPHKVPKTIDDRRCASFNLKPVDEDDLIDLLSAVCAAEEMTTPNDVVDICARAANGSPARALINLTKCEAIEDVEEAARLLEQPESSKEAIDLIRGLLNGANWNHIQTILQQMTKTNPENARHTIRAYLTKVIINSKTKEQAAKSCQLLEHFAFPWNEQDQLSPLVLAVGRILFAQEI